MSFYTRQADELRRRGKARGAYATFLATRLDKGALLRRAWGLARDGARRFGGKVGAYFASALAMAWQEAKTRIATARAMAEDRRAMETSRFGLTVVGLLVAREGALC
jgi:hypothetical protein